MPKSRYFLGFTLIELLVVVAIIGVLSTIGFSAYQTVQSKARDSIRKNDLTKLATALELYYQKNGSYPAGNSTDPYACARDSDAFYADEMKNYLSNRTIPADPQPPARYCYISTNNGQAFRLYAKLEKCNDSAGNLCRESNYNHSVYSDNLTLLAAAPSAISPSPSPSSAPVSTPTSIPVSSPTPTPIPVPAVAARPDSLAGLSLWLKADAITGLNNNDPLNTWTASSGANATSAGSAKPLYKTNVLNGKPAVFFDGIDDVMSIDSQVGIQSAFVVVNSTRGDNFGDFDGILTSNPDSNTIFFIGKAGTTELYQQGDLGPTGGGPLTSSSYIVNRLPTNNLNPLTDYKMIFGDRYSTRSPTGLLIGNDRGLNRHWKGHILEIITYNRALSAVEKNNVEEYLSQKYGIILSP